MSRLIGGLTALGTKLGIKFIVVIIKFAKALKFGKLGLAGLTTASYAYMFTWKFALMVMVLLFVHEYGHIWAMKRCGLKTKGIYFIPFMGAAAIADEEFKSRKDETYIAIMGPIWGLGLSLIAWIIYIETGDALFGAAAGFMAMINLFNLLPVNPLDGGRMMKSMLFSIHSGLGFVFMVAGIIVSIFVTFYFGMILFVILLIVAILELLAEYMRRDPGIVVKHYLMNLNKIKYDGLHPRVRIVINDMKAILSNGDDSPIVRMEKFSSRYVELYTKDRFNMLYEMPEDVVKIYIDIRMKIEGDKFRPIPKMTSREILVSAVSYVLTVAILWGLMTHMMNIPEVTVAREIFMS